MPSRTQFVHEHLSSIDSTNAELLRRAQAQSIHGQALSADVQTAGRGQRGRLWHANAGDALLLSVGWHFARGESIDGLSLAVGVIVARAAQRFASERITLKWPNDLLLDDRAKLGGILIETVQNNGDERIAVIGIGINVRPPEIEAIRRVSNAHDALPAAALLSGVHPRGADGALIVRNALAQSLLDELERALPIFAKEGLQAFRDDWWARRAYADLRVRVLAAESMQAASAISGSIVDLQESGALVIDDGRTLHTLHSALISIRPINA
jgi:BirA family transcriptional regulator, biotin operon repressor / biotin---[acetyl-CoA-carboxylase] ligase